MLCMQSVSLQIFTGRRLLRRDGGKLVLSQSNPLTLKRKTSKFAQLVLIKSIEGLLMEQLATVEEAAVVQAAAAAVASSLVHHDELKQPNYTTSSLLPSAHHFQTFVEAS